MKKKLRCKLPPDRTYKQIKNHYEVEKEIATRLKHSTREERTKIFETMYDELFSKVPDHPRLTRRESKRKTELVNLSKYKCIKEFLGKQKNFLEFAPGDCRFSILISKYVRFVYGVDISDQAGEIKKLPKNFQLIIYDGYNLNIGRNKVDIVFSDQLIEHIHPEEVEHHFNIVKSILKNKGVYVFRTPHKFVGPSDISKYFSDTAEGFHLKEWTYNELYKVINKIGFRSSYARFLYNDKYYKIPLKLVGIVESLSLILPHFIRKEINKYLFNQIHIVIIR